MPNQHLLLPPPHSKQSRTRAASHTVSDADEISTKFWKDVHAPIQLFSWDCIYRHWKLKLAEWAAQHLDLTFSLIGQSHFFSHVCAIYKISSKTDLILTTCREIRHSNIQNVDCWLCGEINSWKQANNIPYADCLGQLLFMGKWWIHTSCYQSTNAFHSITCRKKGTYRLILCMPAPCFFSIFGLDSFYMLSWCSLSKSVNPKFSHWCVYIYLQSSWRY